MKRKLKIRWDRVAVACGCVFCVAMIPVMAWMNTHSVVKAIVIDRTGNIVTFQTLNGHEFSAYVDRESELKEWDKVKLVLKNNDQTTWADDEVIDIR